jgi:hypothetical protein
MTIRSTAKFASMSAIILAGMSILAASDSAYAGGWAGGGQITARATMLGSIKVPVGPNAPGPVVRDHSGSSDGSTITQIPRPKPHQGFCLISCGVYLSDGPGRDHRSYGWHGNYPPGTVLHDHRSPSTWQP